MLSGLGLEGELQEIAGRKVRSGLATWRPPLAVDRRFAVQRKADGPCGFAHARTTCQLVLKLVRQLENPINGLVIGYFVAQLVANIGIGCNAPRLDRQNPEEVPAEVALNRIADCTFLKSEHGIRCTFRKIAAHNLAKSGRIRIHTSEIQSDGMKVVPALNPVISGASCVLVEEQDLLDVANFLDGEPADFGFVPLLDLGLVDLKRLGDRLGAYGYPTDCPVLRRLVAVRVGIVERLWRRLAVEYGNGLGQRAQNRNRTDPPGLAIPKQGVDNDIRGRLEAMRPPSRILRVSSLRIPATNSASDCWLLNRKVS